jgi:hypothetical protein
VGTESETLKRTASRVAWSIFVLIVLSTVAGEAVSAAQGSGVDGFAIFVMSFPLVGALIVSSRPDNNVGWVMLGIGALLGVSELLEIYAVFGLDVRPGSLPVPGVALALNAPMWVPVIGLPGTFLILLFPDGRLPSSRWRPWGWFCLAALVLSYLAILIQPYEFVDEGYPGVTNPFGIDAMASFAGPLLATLLSIPIAIVGCALALRQRFRRSRGLNRLQLKWLAAAAGMVAAVYGVSMLVSLPFNIAGSETPAWLLWSESVSIFPFFLLPIAVGIAILKHRLYDIDVIINRALVYGTLTVALTTAYIVAIAALQVIARPFAGQSQLAVAGSTLAVAALFQPARVRIQAFIDRRFYRSKFDAGKTLDDFSARLRDEVNLETLTADLLAVVDQTMRPAHRSLWLREAGVGNPTAQPRQ